MAYVKFKELTHYFNFYKEIAVKELPEFINQYISNNEKVLKAYGTKRDKCIFTSNKIILFDVKGFLGNTKKIHLFHYSSICTSAIVFKESYIFLLFTFNSGYQLRLNYIKLSPQDKKEFRELYVTITEKK